MALTRLRQKDQPDYSDLNIQAFEYPPMLTIASTVDLEISVQLEGWLNSQPDNIVFVVTNKTARGSTLSVGSDANTIDVQIVNESTTKDTMTYHIVDIGVNVQDDDWALDFQIIPVDGEDAPGTGKWRFVKGKKESDE